MQTITLENLVESVEIKKNNQSVFGDKVGFFGRLFGCWHENLSRPFVQDKTAYRACLECGARRQFDPQTLKTHGAFYYPPIVRKIS
jgi:hypothetical protein